MTDDGVPLALYRYVPEGGGRFLPPVLLVGDLGMNREVFDLDGVGLAPFLREHGRDVFVIEPRGHGSSGVPINWHIRDIIAHDLPAVLRVIRADRTEPIDLVVHGYLGALVMAATTREWDGQVGKVVALATPATAEVPNGLAESVLEHGGNFTSLTLDPEGRAVFEMLFAKHGRFAGGRLEALRQRGFSDLGSAAASELLAWMRSGDFAFADGSSLRARLARYDRPTLELIPLRDNWVHPEHASMLREVAPKAPVLVRVLSLLQYLEEDYTHLSVLQGEGVRRDVFPLIPKFFAAPIIPRGESAAEGGAR